MDATSPFLESLAAYPRWLVVACLTILAAAGLWVLAKVLKWTLYLVIALVLLGGGAAVVWLLVERAVPPGQPAPKAYSQGRAESFLVSVKAPRLTLADEIHFRDWRGGFVAGQRPDGGVAGGAARDARPHRPYPEV
jgi:hypothetical protein